MSAADQDRNNQDLSGDPMTAALKKHSARGKTTAFLEDALRKTATADEGVPDFGYKLCHTIVSIKNE